MQPATLAKEKEKAAGKKGGPGAVARRIGKKKNLAWF
jgi:hypothetical protein